VANFLKKVINILLNFFLVVLVLIFVVSLITKNTVLNEQYILGKLESLNYYSKVVDNVKDSFKENILQSGLDEEEINEIVDEEKIKNDVNGFIHSIYSSESYKIETKNIINKLNEKIDEKLNLNGKIMTEENKKAIEKFLEAISDAYVAEISFIDGSANIVKNVLVKIEKLLDFANIFLIVGIVILMLVLILLNRNLNFLIITLFTSAVLLIFVNLFVNFSIQIDNVLIFTESFSELLRTVMNDYFGLYLKVGIISAVIALIVQVICEVIKNRTISKY